MYFSQCDVTFLSAIHIFRVLRKIVYKSDDFSRQLRFFAVLVSNH